MDEQRLQDFIVENVAKTIIHDFMNCLSYIRCYCELIVGSEINTDEIKEFAQNSINDIDKLKSMSNGVMDYIRCQNPFDFDHHNIAEFINDIVSAVKDNLDSKGIKLNIKQGYDGDFVMDACRLRQAILNIINNTSEALPKGGELSISTALLDNELEFIIKDNGKGIPKAVRDRVFEPFLVSGKKSHAGLGLTFAKKVIDCHRGRITLESSVEGEESGKTPGTIFTIRLPLNSPIKKV